MDNIAVTPYIEPENDSNNIPMTDTAQKPDTISIKYNKEIIKIPLDEAVKLIQKGKKYEDIQKSYDRVVTLARADGKSMNEFLGGLEKERKENRRNELLNMSGGNEQLSSYVLELEEKSKTDDGGFKELKEMFPEINQIGELPQEVVEYSNLTGKDLLDSYLRHIYSKKIISNNKNTEIAAVNNVSAGSLKKGCLPDCNAVSHEFLKGLWQK